MRLHRRPTLISRVVFAMGMLVASHLLSACIATPLPDPPSVDALQMTLMEDGPGFVRLGGSAGAIRMGGEALRVTNARLDVRTNILVAADGSFTTRIEGVLGDRLYLERLRSDAQTFLAAVESAGSARVASVSMLSDRDMDLSPDAIDCAPDDATFVARECAVACMTDMECGGGQACVAGVCAPRGCELAETCGDGLDNDCDGVPDDGC